MIKDLSAREKAMLYILAVFMLAFACLYFLIIPTAERTRELRAAVDATRETDTAMRAVLKGADYAAQIAQLEEQIAQHSSRRLAIASNTALDAMITGMITKCGLTPQSLALGQPRIDTVAKFGSVSDAQTDMPARAAQNTANAVFSGSLSGFERFLSEIDVSDAMRVTYVSYSRPSEDDGYTFTVGLVIYIAEEALE